MAKFKNIISSLIFIFAIVFIFGSAWHSHDEPLERDLTTYGYVAHALLSGQRLYTDLWDHKPPGIYIAYALAELTWGYGQHALILLWVVVTIMSTFLIFLILDRISGLYAALLGVFFWVLSANSVYLEANQANTEIFLNLFTLIALWALICFDNSANRYLHIVGWAMAIATIFKPIAVFVLLAMLLYILLPKNSASGRWPIKEYLIRSLLLLYPVAFLWCSMMGYAFLVGRFKDFWDILIIYNSQYSGNSLANIWLFFNNPSYLFSKSLYGIWVLVVFSYAWLFIGSRSPNIRVPHRFFVIITIGILFEIGSLGLKFPHYFQTLIPIVTINASLFLLYIFKDLKTKPLWRWLLGSSLSTLFVITTFYHQVTFFKMNPYDLSNKKYGNQYIDAQEIGFDIAAITQPEDLIYYWGSESGVYFYSQRQSASGVFINLPIEDKRNKNAGSLLIRLLRDLENTPPEVFIWNSGHGKPENSNLSEFVSANYHFLGNRDRFQIYLRNEP
ncbi:glycosyltransferase family 39 protein [bacterium]|nr:glycosyltransferase family 39 protein [bacterium]